eukprot:1158078-Pelagomonas_calceolata.AAC.3
MAGRNVAPKHVVAKKLTVLLEAWQGILGVCGPQGERCGVAQGWCGARASMLERRVHACVSVWHVGAQSPCMRACVACRSAESVHA